MSDIILEEDIPSIPCLVQFSPLVFEMTKMLKVNKQRMPNDGGKLTYAFSSGELTMAS
jgi:hypothetical protein